MSCCEEEGTGISIQELHEIAKRRKLEREGESLDVKRPAIEEESEQEDDSNSIGEEEETGEEVTREEEEGRNGDEEDEGNMEEGLTVLTQHETAGKEGPVKYQLPKWVTQYHPIMEDISSHSVPLDSFKLHHKVKSNLLSMGVKTLFPVQATVMPTLIQSAKGPLLTQPNGLPPSDVCVCAPTGCGKTLAYVIPMVHAIASECNTCKLRGLVVVPSQDLALQVSSVFKEVSKGTLLNIGVFCGQKTLDEEIEAVAIPGLGSKVDILVCTPGRLVSHLQRFPHCLSLYSLRYLVIDEVDRIFEQHYHNWLDRVMEATQKETTTNPTVSMIATSSVPFVLPELLCSLPKLTPPSEPSPNLHTPSAPGSVQSYFSLKKQPLQKLLFSATLSLDPEKLSLLCLNRPMLYSVSAITGENIGETTLPSTLSESMIICTLQRKPLYLVYLLSVFEEGNSVLCFTHSKFSTHRLKLVLQQYKINVEEISASISQESRKAVIKRFESGKVKVLVCSDGMSRGMDIGSVNCVVNYDVPAHFKSYLHRVGRTARAGAKGTAYTILTNDEVASFNRIVRNAQRSKKIKKISVTNKDIKPFIDFYSKALENVAAIVGQ